MKYLILTMIGINLLAASAFLLGKTGGNLSTWKEAGYLFMGAVGTLAISMGAFSGRAAS